MKILDLALCQEEYDRSLIYLFIYLSFLQDNYHSIGDFNDYSCH